MNHVEIIFTGIVMFIAATGNRPMTAIALNAPTPVVSSSGETIPAHVTWIRFDARQLDPDSEVQPDRIVHKDGVPYGVVLVHGEQIEVANAPVVEDLELADGVPATDGLPTERNRHFLYWVPRMRDIYPGEHRINPAYLAENPDPALVSARMTLQHGHLSTSHVEPVVWQFLPQSGPMIRRAIAQEVSLDQTVTGVLALTLRKFSTVETRTLRFRGGDVAVMIGNSPDEDIEPNATERHVMNVDHHFELYYRIFSDVPALKPVPHLVSAMPAEGGGRLHAATHRAGGNNCGPTQWP